MPSALLGVLALGLILHLPRVLVLGLFVLTLIAPHVEAKAPGRRARH